MKKGRIIAAVIALLVIAGVGGCILLGAQAAVPVVSTGFAERGELARTVTVSGSTATDERSDVYPPTAGTLDEVHVSDGDEVKAGDVLAVMDTGPLELQVASAEAAYSAALAQLAAVDAQAPSTEDQEAAEAGADVAYAAYQNAGDSADEVSGVVDSLRAAGVAEDADLASIVTTDPVVIAALAEFQALVLKGLVPTAPGMTVALLDAQAQTLEAAEDQAYVAYLQARAAANALDVDLGASRASAQSGADSAARALAAARDTLADATITAPIDGVVVFNAAPDITGTSAGGPAPGYSVSPAAPPFTIVRLGFLEFVCDVDEADVDALDEDMSATVFLDAFPGDEFMTKVRKIGVVSQPTATGGNAFPVHMDLAETGQDILVGMRGSADIELELIGNSVSVPIEALFDDDDGSFVYLIEDDVLARQDVEAGVYTDTQVQILAGLEGDEEVVLSSSAELADGMRVRVGEDGDAGGMGFLGAQD